ncbi:distal tail protein Dit [Rummeliibacillus stabekisii]|uniref:distal tail protein Dit n=1 Tax=Rummeliibacillus stabekisii TaxID=241244 RepID=UPI003721AFE8
MAQFMGIVFNEIMMPDFVRVTAIKHSILPPITQTLETVGGRAGSYDYGNTIGNREIKVSIDIVEAEPNTLPSLLSQLATWLYYDEPKELILGDNPNKYYFAKITGDTDVSEEFILGSGEITFICSDPYIYGDDYQYTLPQPYYGDIINVVNVGQADTYPEMEFTIAKNLTNFSVVANDEFIDLGTPFEEDIDTTPVDYKDDILHDALKTTEGWSPASSDYKGTVLGSMEIFDNSVMRQAGLDYGKAAGWHGASVIKGLKQSATNFELKYGFMISTQAHADYVGTMVPKETIKARKGASTKYKLQSKIKYEKGKSYKIKAKYQKKDGVWFKMWNGYYVHYSPKTMTYRDEQYKADKMGMNNVYLTDENSSPLLMCSVFDNTSSNRQLTAEVKVIGTAGGAHIILKKAIPSKYDSFEGYWLIKRKDNTWYVSLYVETSSGKHKRLFYKKWKDAKKQYRRDIAKAQISTLAYSDYPACYMSCRDIIIQNLDKDLDEDSVPLILRKGDVLYIDNETGSILKNGKPFYEFLNPSSSFIKLESGNNGIAISPANAFSEGIITYSERSL